MLDGAAQRKLRKTKDAANHHAAEGGQRNFRCSRMHKCCRPRRRPCLAIWSLFGKISPKFQLGSKKDVNVKASKNTHAFDPFSAVSTPHIERVGSYFNTFDIYQIYILLHLSKFVNFVKMSSTSHQNVYFSSNFAKFEIRNFFETFRLTFCF